MATHVIDQARAILREIPESKWEQVESISLKYTELGEYAGEYPVPVINVTFNNNITPRPTQKKQFTIVI